MRRNHNNWAACDCRFGGCSGHLSVSESRSDFPGVDHEGRQACLKNEIIAAKNMNLRKLLQRCLNFIILVR